MKQAWRWFGPHDPVSLDDVRQAGASDIVNALHQLKPGEVWTEKAVAERKHLIDTTPAGRTPLTWSIVESIPVPDDVKRLKAFDIVGYWNAFNNRPCKWRATCRRRIDQVLALGDRLLRPHLAGLELMQRIDNIAGTGLAHIIEAYGIMRPKPTPCLFHAGYFLIKRGLVCRVLQFGLG